MFGAEPENADDCARSMAAGKVIINETWPDTVCDSLRYIKMSIRIRQFSSQLIMS